MINFILTTIFKSKDFIIGLSIIIIFIIGICLVDSYLETENEIKQYKRIEEETKVFHEENIIKLKTALKIRDNAKKIDYNDSGNLDDDFLLKSLE